MKTYYNGTIENLAKTLTLFEVICASPPCTEYSRAKKTGVRNIDYANSIVTKTIEIINYFQPNILFVEHPQTGLLKEQEFMKDFDYYDVYYCISMVSTIESERGYGRT